MRHNDIETRSFGLNCCSLFVPAHSLHLVLKLNSFFYHFVCVCVRCCCWYKFIFCCLLQTDRHSIAHYNRAYHAIEASQLLCSSILVVGLFSLHLSFVDDWTFCRVAITRVSMASSSILGFFFTYIVFFFSLCHITIFRCSIQMSNNYSEYFLLIVE